VCALQRQAATVPSSLLASSMTSGKAARSTSGRCAKTEAELAEQSPDAVDAGGALFLVAFTQSGAEPPCFAARRS
jgi:hypothetical protein